MMDYSLSGGYPGRLGAVENILARVHTAFGNDSIDEELKQYANAELHAIQADLDLVKRGDEGYEDFLVAFLSREAERFRADDVDSVPYPKLRETPLCTCSDGRCYLKRGQLPQAIRDAESTDRGIQWFVQRHAGDPLVLDHDEQPVGARQRFSQKRGGVKLVLRHLQSILSANQETVPAPVAAPDGNIPADLSLADLQDRDDEPDADAADTEATA